MNYDFLFVNINHRKSVNKKSHFHIANASAFASDAVDSNPTTGKPAHRTITGLYLYMFIGRKTKECVLFPFNI